MKFENTEVWGFEHALRGMRNPMNSWAKSDSYKDNNKFIIGSNDLELALKLIKAGSEHRKFLRQIFISVDITAPLYWWKEADTYKVGTVANSTSTMHKLTSTEITKDCFEKDELLFCGTVNMLENLRKEYIICNNPEIKKRIFKQLIVNLPESWLQKRTVTMNYENILSIYNQRKNHKLTEWSEDFIQWIKNLPYSNLIIN